MCRVQTQLSGVPLETCLKPEESKKVTLQGRSRDSHHLVLYIKKKIIIIKMPHDIGRGVKMTEEIAAQFVI